MSVDYNWVTERLATGGGLSSEADVQQLVADGITHVVDVTDAENDQQFVATEALIVCWNPTADDGQHPKPVSWFQTSLNFALPVFPSTTGKVYAHCSAGVNRGPSTCYAILRALGLTAAQAEAMIRAARPQVGLAYQADADAAVVALGYVKA